MSPPCTWNGRPSLPAETARAGSYTHPQRTSLVLHPAAFASAYAPCGRRAMWLVTVTCPHCHGIHVHRVRDLADAPGLRRPGCRPAATYWVVIAEIHPPDASPQEVTA